MTVACIWLGPVDALPMGVEPPANIPDEPTYGGFDALVRACFGDTRPEAMDWHEERDARSDERNAYAEETRRIREEMDL